MSGKKLQEEKRELSRYAPSSGAAWFYTGWQRKWLKTTGNNGYAGRVFSRGLTAGDRYQRENGVGKYAIPNVSHEARSKTKGEL
jgi:hypothetical protein